MLTAIHFADQLHAVVVSVPSNLVLCGYPMGGPAWLLDGEALPYADDFGPACNEPRALLSVEAVRGPVMFVSAGRDEVWPSAPMARAMAKRLKGCGDVYGHELLEYPDASHSLGYLAPVLPATVKLGDLRDPPPSKVARADAFPRLLRFIQTMGSAASDRQ